MSMFAISAVAVYISRGLPFSANVCHHLPISATAYNDPPTSRLPQFWNHYN